MPENADATPGLSRDDLVRVLESAARLHLNVRFDTVLEAIEATEGWVTNRVAPGKIILGELGDIESGVRQLIRSRPLEVTEVELPSGQKLRVPTPEETLRIKG